MNEKDFEKLVFGMAHQIRNPCAIIKSNANLLLQKSNFAPEMRRSLEAILNGVKYLEERLDEFVEFSKPLRLNLKAISVKQIFQEVISVIREKAHLQKIQISTIMDENLILPKVDSHQIFLALLNILLNAIESIPTPARETGVSPVGERAGVGTIPQEGGKVTIKARVRMGEKSSDQNFVKILVTDTGCGIHPRDLPEVFSPFYSTKKGGIGIGLAVAKRIIDGHNGKIDLSSQQGKGTTVTIQLPL